MRESGAGMRDVALVAEAGPVEGTVAGRLIRGRFGGGGIVDGGGALVLSASLRMSALDGRSYWSSRGPDEAIVSLS